MEKQMDVDKVLTDEQNLRILIDHTDDPIWLIDVGCNIIECNASFRKWVSFFAGRELRKGDNVMYGILGRDYLDKFETCYQEALSGRAFSSVEDMVIEGEVRYTTITFNPVFDNTGHIKGVSCFARDITEKRRHLLKIEEQNMVLREIASIESHKVRGPVATILGLEQFFNYEDLADPINKEIMQGITKVSQELDGVIREVVRKSNEMGLD
jgi:PAS domain S-box-containing protein